MGDLTLIVLFVALIADWYLGEPDILWSRFPHPVVVFGKAISFVEKRFNLVTLSNDQRFRNGAFAISGLIIASILSGLLLESMFTKIGVAGWILEGFIVFTLLAQRSLIEHVQAVADGLRQSGLAGGRKAIAMIVGRNPDVLERPAVCRAAIETLAENFSDGVVAPAFWYAVFGLPGIIAYKMINTADSMIGYHNERYEHFGKAAAKIDDLANWLPARISALLIVAGALIANGFQSAVNAFGVALRDAGLHRSPNAGWPEAAMAGAIGVALGGPRIYPGETVQQALLNASGKSNPDIDDIENAIGIFAPACMVLMAAIAIIWIIF